MAPLDLAAAVVDSPDPSPFGDAAVDDGDLTNAIVTYWFASEDKHRPAPDYLRHQPDLNGKMRELLIDWLQEVAVRFRFQPETMFLAVALVDRFLSRKAVNRKKLQLVGCVGLILAAKYEETYTPAINDFLVVSDHAFTRDHVLQMESIVLNALDFRLTQVTPLRFLQVFLLPLALPPVHALLAHYLLEATLQYVKLLEYRPSTIAAAVVYLVAHQVHWEAAGGGASEEYVWSDARVSQTRHTVDQLLPCLGDVYTHWSSLSSRAAAALASGAVASGGPGNRCLAVYRKYGRERCMQVNLVRVEKPGILDLRG